MTSHDENDDKPAGDGAGEVVKDVVPPITKTPLYQAIHASRYQRQALIREIEALAGNKLICYIAGISAPVDREDVVCFVDLLHNITCGQNVDLMLHTGGGDIDAAEKLMAMIRKKVSTGQVRVIVPDYAKSAGTLMALHWRSVMNRLCGWLPDAIGVLSRRVAGGVATYVLCGCCSGYVL